MPRKYEVIYLCDRCGTQCKAPLLNIKVHGNIYATFKLHNSDEVAIICDPCLVSILTEYTSNLKI